ncbi:MAG: Chemotaxis regulator - transmits chemoreceptor signals to flagelllar motor component CheY [Labilithrix sp.]|nr:Chemotaxis regulator - transmits chemoreceptor signals to flagelllar motor component CheY [Labilithrix sp.]
MTFKPKAPSTRPPPPPAVGSVRPPSNLKDALAEARAMTGAGLQRQSSVPGSAFPAAARKTVIVVDEDPAMRERLRAGIEPFYDVVEASDGMEAATLASQGVSPAMIVCEVVMPRLDGFTLARIMKGNPLTKRIPIMFVSSRNTPQDVTQALVLGACHYFPKTTPIAEIVAKIRKIVL